MIGSCKEKYRTVDDNHCLIVRLALTRRRSHGRAVSMLRMRNTGNIAGAKHTGSAYAGRPGTEATSGPRISLVYWASGESLPSRNFYVRATV